MGCGASSTGGSHETRPADVPAPISPPVNQAAPAKTPKGASPPVTAANAAAPAPAVEQKGPHTKEEIMMVESDFGAASQGKQGGKIDPSWPERLVVKGGTFGGSQGRMGGYELKREKEYAPYNKRPVYYNKQTETWLYFSDDNAWTVSDGFKADSYAFINKDSSAMTPDVCKTPWLVYDDPDEREDPELVVQKWVPRTAAPSGANQYVDKEFPPNDKSLALEGDERPETAVEWVRVPQVGDKLWDSISFSDIDQGGVGNCWLIAAICAAAEFPESIFNLFESKQVSLEGKYVFKFFDAEKKKWVQITIDDQIPCNKAEWYEDPTPLFAKPHGGAVWLVLLEKAFAKWAGGYGKLSGGFQPHAWQAITGALGTQMEMWNKEQDGKWHQFHMGGTFTSAVQRGEGKGEGTEGDTPPVTSAELWKKMVEWDKSNFLMGAAFDSEKQGDDLRPDGLVGNHAYALLQVREFPSEKLQLVQLMNPWGKGGAEWKGAWSDKAPEWSKFPQVAKAVDKKAEEDGAFWMSFNDFAKLFTEVEVCCKAMPGCKGKLGETPLPKPKAPQPKPPQQPPQQPSVVKPKVPDQPSKPSKPTPSPSKPGQPAAKQEANTHKYVSQGVEKKKPSPKCPATFGKAHQWTRDGECKNGCGEWKDGWEEETYACCVCGKAECEQADENDFCENCGGEGCDYCAVCEACGGQGCEQCQAAACENCGGEGCEQCAVCDNCGGEGCRQCQ